MVPGSRPVALIWNVVLPVPMPTPVPPDVGTRVPNVSLHVPGLVVSMRNQPVVDSPPGFTVALSEAELAPMPVGVVVVTTGAAARADKETTDATSVRAAAERISGRALNPGSVRDVKGSRV